MGFLLQFFELIYSLSKKPEGNFDNNKQFVQHLTKSNLTYVLLPFIIFSEFNSVTFESISL